MAKIITVKEAAELVQDGAVIGSAVQGMTGWPEAVSYTHLTLPTKLEV